VAFDGMRCRAICSDFPAETGSLSSHYTSHCNVNSDLSEFLETSEDKKKPPER